MRKPLIAGAALLCLTPLAACGGSEEKPTAAPTSAAASQPATTAAAQPGAKTAAPRTAVPKPGFVPPELKFNAKGLQGQALDGSQLAGRPVVLWFRTAACAACKKQVKSLVQVARLYQGQVEFIVVEGRAKPKAGTPTATVPTRVADPGLALFRRFKVRKPGTFVFVRRDGSMSNAPSPVSAKVLTAVTKSLLKP